MTDALATILPPQIILTISVTSTTTAGKPIPPKDLQECIQACQVYSCALHIFRSCMDSPLHDRPAHQSSISFSLCVSVVCVCVVDQAIIELEMCKEAILKYIESRMVFLAPNLTALVTPPVAARMIGLAGGLEELSKIPACNLQVLGAKRTSTVS